MPTPEPPASIVVDGLTKRYGGRTAVADLSLTVHPGEVLALLGPNGSGKTTTVECIAGLRAPDMGTVSVFGVNPRREREQVVGRLGVMLQEGGTHRSATPAELLRTFAAYYDDPLEPLALIERLGLGQVAAQRVRTLSGGERQRVALALALVGQPRVALLDEPTAGMDPAARRQTWALVQELRTGGVAILLTTHAMEEAERLADRVAVVDGGTLIALDRPSALAGAKTGLLVETTTTLDPATLAEDLGVAVSRAGDGRWHVAASTDMIAEVSSWFAARGLPLTGIAAARERLEDVYLRLTDSPDEAA